MGSRCGGLRCWLSAKCRCERCKRCVRGEVERSKARFLHGCVLFKGSKAPWHGEVHTQKRQFGPGCCGRMRADASDVGSACGVAWRVLRWGGGKQAKGGSRRSQEKKKKTDIGQHRRLSSYHPRRLLRDVRY
eukprot:623414-Rhodomonas_salina.1